MGEKHGDGVYIDSSGVKRVGYWFSGDMKEYFTK